jgi:hypothetical protein
VPNQAVSAEMPEKVDIPIDAGLYEACEERIARTEFDSTSEYLEYILEEVISINSDENESTSSEVDEGHLKALGYLEE